MNTSKLPNVGASWFLGIFHFYLELKTVQAPSFLSRTSIRITFMNFVFRLFSKFHILWKTKVQKVFSSVMKAIFKNERKVVWISNPSSKINVGKYIVTLKLFTCLGQITKKNYCPWHVELLWYYTVTVTCDGYNASIPPWYGHPTPTPN